MKVYQSDKIRNVALISHGGAGKTSLAEAMLFTSKATNRLGNVGAGTTVTDYDPDEIKRQITINTAFAPLEWKGCKINVLDTPGFFDFVGDLLAALRVTDAAVVTVCGVSGLEVGTEKVWRYADEYKLPRFIFINKLDREHANFDKVFAQMRKAFGLKVVPLQIPIGKEADFCGVVDLIRMKALLFSESGACEEKELSEELAAEAEGYREKLLESVAESDDELLMKFLEGEEISEEEIVAGLRSGVLENKICPVLCGAAAINFGALPLLDMISSILPSPVDMAGEEVLPPEGEEGGEKITLDSCSDGPLAAFVFKTMVDPYVGKINYFRVYSGTLKSDTQVYNASKDKTERIGQLFLMRGKTQISVNEAMAGDIAAVAKLQVTATGDSFSEKADPVVFSGIDFPKPVISFAVEAKEKGDEEKIGAGLNRFLEEDQTFSVERNRETKQMIIAGMGDLHLEIIINRLARKFGTKVTLSTPKVPYKETIRKQVKTEGKYKKQSGGRGQYGHVFLELEPLKRSEGFKFINKIVGGVVPRQYIPAVEKGVKEAMEKGVLAGYPTVDLQVKIVDGSYHTVDSSEMAFKIAGAMAFRKGAEQAAPVLLEPIMDVEVMVPEVFMGDVMGDLNGRRGRIQGMEPGDGFQKIKAQVPQSEMFRYSIDLRSMTQGRGFFTLTFSHYEEVPAQISEKIISDSKDEM